MILLLLIMLINLRCLTYLQSSSKYSNLEGLLLEKEDGVSKNTTHTQKKIYLVTVNLQYLMTQRQIFLKYSQFKAGGKFERY